MILRTASIVRLKKAYLLSMAETIQINVKSVNGQKFSVRVKTNDTTEQLIAATAAVSGYAANTIRLIHAGKDITESQGKTVDELGVENGSTLFVVMRLAGGQFLPQTG